MLYNEIDLMVKLKSLKVNFKNGRQMDEKNSNDIYEWMKSEQCVRMRVVQKWDASLKSPAVDVECECYCRYTKH